jgi:hypothetical protein
MWSVGDAAKAATNLLPFNRLPHDFQADEAGKVIRAFGGIRSFRALAAVVAVAVAVELQ